jgi:hypothetical protein
MTDKMSPNVVALAMTAARASSLPCFPEWKRVPERIVSAGLRVKRNCDNTEGVFEEDAVGGGERRPPVIDVNIGIGSEI